MVQGTKRSKSANVNLPRLFCEKLGIGPGDLLAIRMNDERELVLDKAYVVPEHEFQEQVGISHMRANNNPYEVT
jgi:hypothetical protein